MLPLHRFVAPVLLLSVSALAVFSCTTTSRPRPGDKEDEEGGTNGSGGAPGHLGDGDSFGGSPSFGGQPALDVCGEPPDTSGSFSKAALLSAASACSAHHACTFENAASDLERTVSEWASDPTEENLGQARAAFRAAMSAWSVVEGFQFGPLADVSSDPYHGRGLRALVHPWPNTNRCNVETQIALREYEGSDRFKYVPASGRGLYAIEYVLFSDFADTACASNQQAAKTWAASSAAELDLARRDYGRAVAADVLDLAEQLVDVWSEDGEDFGSALLAHEGYGNEQEALNIVAWALMYPEAEIKDWKLGPRSSIPLSPAPFGAENPYALLGLENIRQNLKAFQALYAGCRAGEGLGFDDWLVAAGAVDLKDEIEAAFERAVAAFEQAPPLHTASTAEIDYLYGELKPLSDLLKGSFFGSGSPLNLKLPASAASDTD